MMSWFKSKEKPPKIVHLKLTDGSCSCKEEHKYITHCDGCGKYQTTTNWKVAEGKVDRYVYCWTCRMRKREVEALEIIATAMEEE